MKPANRWVAPDAADRASHPKRREEQIRILIALTRDHCPLLESVSVPSFRILKLSERDFSGQPFIAVVRVIPFSRCNLRWKASW
jgi:hypothetical protein